MLWRRWRISALRQLQLRDSKSGFSKVTCIERVFRPLVPRDAKPHNLLTHCPANLQMDFNIFRYRRNLSHTIVLRLTEMFEVTMVLFVWCWVASLLYMTAVIAINWITNPAPLQGSVLCKSEDQSSRFITPTANNDSRITKPISLHQ